jgi:hypothetical protein
MPDEIKSPSSPLPEGEPKPTADQPAVPGGVKATSSGSVQSETTSAPAKPSVPSQPPMATAPEKPAVAAAAASTPGTPAPAAAKPAPPPKTAVPVPTPWDSPMIAKLKGEYGSGIEPLTYLGQNYMVVDRSMIPEILQILRTKNNSITASTSPLCIIPSGRSSSTCSGVLYSFARNERIRVKTLIADGETIAQLPSPSGRRRIGWSAKCTTCSAFGSTGILT